MQPRDLAHDRQAQAGAFHRLPAGAAIEAPEHRIAFGRRNAGAVVDDSQLRHPILTRHAHRHHRAASRIADRVVDQVSGQLLQQLGLPNDLDLTVLLETQVDPGSTRYRRPLQRHRLRQRIQPQRLQRRFIAGIGLQPRERQQLLHAPGCVPHGAVQHAHMLAHAFAVAFAQRQFGLRLDDRQRSLELVRGIGKEALARQHHGM